MATTTDLELMLESTGLPQFQPRLSAGRTVRCCDGSYYASNSASSYTSFEFAKTVDSDGYVDESVRVMVRLSDHAEAYAPNDADTEVQISVDPVHGVTLAQAVDRLVAFATAELPLLDLIF